MKHLYLFSHLLILSFFLSPILLLSQNNLIDWQKSYGGTSYDGAYQIKQTSDEGYIVCGYSWSNNGDVKGHHGSNGYYPDGWVMKLKANGDTLWTRSLGGTFDDYANAVIETDDGNFVVALQSQSNDGDVSVNKGGYDYWIVKLDSSGAILWEKSYGGTGYDNATSVVQSSDGNYVVAGYSNSTGGDIVGNKGYDDFWIIKISETNGTIIWKKNYGGTDDDDAMSISNTLDNGFIVAGYTFSNDINVTVNQGYDDYWVIKLDSAGNLQWQKSMGGDYFDEANSVTQTSDSGYIIAGATYSSAGSGNVSVHYGGWDYWLVKLNSSGTQILWEKTYGGTLHDIPFSIVQTSDIGYMIAGYSQSINIDVSGNHGDRDFWTAKLDNAGTIQWSSTFGGDSLEYCFTMIQANDGGYALAGLSRSSNEDVSSNKGEVDLWIVKIFCNPPYTPDICLVTVDDIASTKNLVVWEKPAVGAIDSFRVYRDVVGNYTYLGSVAYSDLSKFTDNTLGINPQITSYKYKISSVDTCGNESPFSSFHKTIHLQINGANLTWDNYVGFSSNFYYRILRDTTGTGIYTVIDSVPNSNFTWTDNFPPASAIANYIIEVVHPSGGCLVTKSAENHNSSRSNRSSSAPPGSIPVADFYASNTSISTGGTVNFSDYSSNTPDSWLWSFPGGNPSTSTLENPQNITYNNAGCYDVTLIATNGSGSNTMTKTCYINVSSGSAPLADFTATAVSISIGDSISFFDLSQNNPTQWQWIFTNGNPSTSTSQNPQNIKYNSNGCFNVTLIATNGSGSNNQTKTCFIAVNPTSIDEFTGTPYRLEIFPNPNSGEFELIIASSALGQETWQIEVSNILGEVILSEQLRASSGQKQGSGLRYSLNVNKGIYVLKASDQTGRALVRKVVVE